MHKPIESPIHISVRNISILKNLEADPDIMESDRELIKKLLSSSSSNGKGTMELIQAVERGSALDEAEILLSRKDVNPFDVNKLRDLMKSIGREDVILKELGTDAVKKFFYLMASKFGGKPYILPFDIEDDELGAYLSFEIARGDPEYQDGCIIEGIKGDPTNIAGNLFLSHLHHKPNFLNILNQSDEISGKEIMDFVRAMKAIAKPRSFYSLALEYFLFNEERLKNVNKLRSRHFAKSALTRIRKQDTEFFRNLNAGYLYR